MNVKVIGSLPTLPINATWYRAIKLHYVKTALAVKHSAHTPSRYSEGKGLYEILYLAEDYPTALYEVEAQLGTPFGNNTANPSRENTWACCNVHVVASKIVDLTSEQNRRAIATSVQELTGDWKGYSVRGDGASPTQQLGAKLFAAGHLEGFMSFSARVPTKRTLVVFPQRLTASSAVEFEYYNGARSTRLQL